MGRIQKAEQYLRDNEIVDLFLYGFYPREIAGFYSISREWVRRILKDKEISSREGGSFLSSRKTKEKAIRDRGERIYKKYGCSLELYNELRGDGDYIKSPLCKFVAQKKNARNRNINWALTLEEWWSFWDGKFHNRGRCRGQFVMSRYKDKGDYSISNVEIVTCTENIIEHYELSHGGDYSETLKNRNITTF